MNYKRKGHRGRHKRNVMDNQTMRVAGNSLGKAGKMHLSDSKHAKTSKSQRNRLAMEEI